MLDQTTTTCSVEDCDQPVLVKVRGLCGRHNARWMKHGDVTTTHKAPNGTPILERLARYGRWEGDCLVWTKSRDAKGYGRTQIGKRFALVTRVLWEHENGRIPEGMMVCHTCDNPPCFRREHLYLGTGSANMQDMYDRNRQGYRGRDVQSHAVLTEQQVHDVRTRYARGGVTQRQLASEYGCSTSTMFRLVHSG